MIQNLFHKQILKNKDKVNKWFQTKREGLYLPFYSSYDIRDSFFKVVPVDANLFPAGFNNICQTDKETSVDLIKNYFEKTYPEIKGPIALLSEEHTKNKYYLENINTIKTLLEEAGFSVYVTVPAPLNEAVTLESSSGASVKIWPSLRKGKDLFIDDKIMSLVICNNDFSQFYSSWVEGLDIPVNPSYQLGWYQRKKSSFFQHYNSLAREFSELIELNPCFFQIRTEKFESFDVNSEESRNQLAYKVDAFLSHLKSDYEKNEIKNDPYVFIKNNSGTYGLGVTEVKNGEEVRKWTYKKRKKMKAVKGGGAIGEVIIQEGIPTSYQSEGQTAEPAIYMIGCQLAGGFLRAHEKKGPQESLNSPGAVYKRLCVSDLNVSVEGNPMENVYGWIAKLGLLATGLEAKQMGIRWNQKNNCHVFENPCFKP